MTDSTHWLQALITIRCEARRGEWVTVHDLAGHLGILQDTVCTECELMAAASHLQVRRAFGHNDIIAVSAPVPHAPQKPRDLADMASAWGFGS